MATESFDAVLAEIRGVVLITDWHLDRLAAAHAAEDRVNVAVGLLRELRAARPLVLYGDAWIDRIDAFLAGKDDARTETAHG